MESTRSKRLRESNQRRKKERDKGDWYSEICRPRSQWQWKAMIARESCRLCSHLLPICLQLHLFFCTFIFIFWVRNSLLFIFWWERGLLRSWRWEVLYLGFRAEGQWDDWGLYNLGQVQIWFTMDLHLDANRQNLIRPLTKCIPYLIDKIWLACLNKFSLSDGTKLKWACPNKLKWTDGFLESNF